MEKLLHRSKGVPAVMLIASVIMAAFFIGIAIWAFTVASSEELHYASYLSSRAKSTQTWMWICGALLIVCGVLVAYTAFFANRTFLLVYEDHVEGLNCSLKYGLLPVTQRIHVSYGDIQLAEVRKKMLYNCVYLLTTTAEYKIQVNRAEQAVAVIRQKIGR